MCHVESAKTFEQTIKSDIDEITRRFDRFIVPSDNLIFMIHRQRANAFSICCQTKNNPDKNLQAKYIDAYSSSEEQDKIITECRTKLSGSAYLTCAWSIAKQHEAERQMSK